MSIKKGIKINLVPAVTVISVLTITFFLHDYVDYLQVLNFTPTQSTPITITKTITELDLNQGIPEQDNLLNIDQSLLPNSKVSQYSITQIKAVKKQDAQNSVIPDFVIDFGNIRTTSLASKYLNVQNGIDRFWNPEWNDEKQMYTNKNVSIKNQSLEIKAKVEEDGTITSGRVDTRGMFATTYGKFEVVAKFPAGTGTFPAIWLLPEDGSYFRDNIATAYEKRSDLSWIGGGEIDIAETLGALPGQVYSVAHTYNSITSGVQPEFGLTYLNSEYSEYHTYGLDWQPDSLTFSVDGITTLEVKKNSENFREWPFNKPFYLIINLAIGGIWNNNFISSELPDGIDRSNQNDWVLSVKSITHYPLTK